MEKTKKTKVGESSIVMLKIKDIVPYENNSKIHTPEQIEKIRDSIISLGYLDKIEVDENNIILSGHGRLKAFYQIDSIGDKEIAVEKYTNLPDAVKKAYRIATNKLVLDTDFDLDKLGKEFNLLEDTEFLSDTGFSLKEITEVWESRGKKSTSQLVEQDKTSTIEHRCPECDHTWTEEFSKQRKRE